MAESELFAFGIPVDVYVSVTGGRCFATYGTMGERRIVAGARTTVHDLLSTARDVLQVDALNAASEAHMLAAMRKQTAYQTLTDVPHVGILGAEPPEEP